MPFNSSSVITAPSPLLCYSNSSSYPILFTCFVKPNPSTSMFIPFAFINVLLLPLYVLVLWMGFRRWRYQCSAASGTTSHSDVFTYQIVTLEIICVLGYVASCCSIYVCSPTMTMIGYYSFCVTYPPQTLFHCFTCVEHYVAVVHPITYRGLGHSDRVRVRNTSIGCIWLFCITLMCITAWYFPLFPTLMFIIIHGIIMTVVCFCSLSVLCTLIRLGLKKVGGGRQQTDQSKQKAFNIILVITGALVLRSCGITVCNIAFSIDSVNVTDACVLVMSACWLYLPSSLVSPLFFLQRTGALAWFCRGLNEGEN